MRPLAISLILALGAAPAAAGDVDFSLRLGFQVGEFGGGAKAFVQAGPTPMAITPPPMTITKPPGAAALQRDRLRAEPDDRDRKRKRRKFRRFHQPFLFYDDYDEPEVVYVPTPAPEPAPPPEAEAAEPPPPPDPRGPTMLPARGAAAEAAFPVGEPLPEDVPHVTLDWRRYDLPEPPRGLVYARVRGQVLLIDPATRVVERHVDPATLGSAGEARESG